MNRLFSIRRRRPNIVDIDTPLQAGVDGYRLKWATNFDGVFASALTSTRNGFIDDNVNRAVIESQPVTGKVRIVFDPDTYSITDTSAFWLQFVPVTGGVEGTPGAATLVLPSTANHGVGVVVIAGTAPNAAPLQLDLPGLMQDIRFTNTDAANPLLVATEDGGPQMSFLFEQGVEGLTMLGTQGSIYVQGGTGDVDFSASFTLGIR